MFLFISYFELYITEFGLLVFLYLFFTSVQNVLCGVALMSVCHSVTYKLAACV